MPGRATWVFSSYRTNLIMSSVFIYTTYAFVSYAVPSSSVNALSSYAKDTIQILRKYLAVVK